MAMENSMEKELKIRIANSWKAFWAQRLICKY